MNKGFWFEIVVPKIDPCIGVAQMCDATIVDKCDEADKKIINHER